MVALPLATPVATASPSPSVDGQPTACVVSGLVASRQILAMGGGTVLCGVSAGMICWFTASVTDSFGPLAALDDGLGLLPYSACPHYDGEAERRPRYHELVAGGMRAGYAADDSAALVFDGETLAEVVTSRPTAAGYRVERIDGAVRETKLPARYLG